MRHLFVLWLVMLMCGGSAYAARPRVAVVASPGAEMAGELLTASLAQTDAFDLVERARLDAVVAEMGLNLAGLTEAGALRLGQLLGAQGMVLLSVEQSATEEAVTQLQSRLVAVEPGVVVWSLPAAADEVGEAWATELADRLRQAAVKLAIDRREAVPVSVLALRLVAPTPQTTALEVQLHGLLTHRLVRSPRLFVLERERLAEVAAEHGLGEEPLAPLWTGSFLIDGEIHVDAGEPVQRVTLKLRLRPPQGEAEVIEASADRDRLPALVDELAAAVERRLLGRAEAPPWDPKREASRFEREAMWLERADVAPTRINAATETAWALGARSGELSRLRIRNELRRIVRRVEWARSISDHPMMRHRLDSQVEANINRYATQLEGERALIDAAIGAIDLLQAEFDDRLKTASANRYDLASRCLGAAVIVLRHLRDTDRWRAHADALVELRRRTRGMVAMVNRRHAEEAGPPRGDGFFLGSAAHFYEQQARYVALYHEEPEDTVASWWDLIAYCDTLRGRTSLEQLPDIFLVWRDPLLTYGDMTISWSGHSKAERALVEQTFHEALLHHHEPFKRLMGLRLSYSLFPDRRDETKQKMQEAIWDLRDAIASGQVTRRELFRFLLTSETSLRLRIYLLDHADTIDPWGLRLGSVPRNTLPTEADAAELRSAILRNRDRLPGLRNTLDQMLKQIDETYPQLPGATVVALPSFTLRYAWHPSVTGDPPEGHEWRHFSPAVLSFRFAEDRLWLVMTAGARFGGEPSFTVCVFAVDLRTGETLRLPVLRAPKHDAWGSHSGAWVTVTNEEVFLVRWPCMFRFDRQTEVWEQIETVHEAYGKPEVLGEHVYVHTVPEHAAGHRSLLRVDRKTESVEVLATTRGETERSPLEAWDVRIAGMQADQAANRLHVVVGHGRKHAAFHFDPATGQWTPEPMAVAEALAPTTMRGHGEHVSPYFHAAPSQWRIGGRPWGAKSGPLHLMPTDGHVAPIWDLSFGEARWPPRADAALLPEGPGLIHEIERGSGHTLFELPEGLVIADWVAEGFWFLPRADLEAAIKSADDTPAPAE